MRDATELGPRAVFANELQTRVSLRDVLSDDKSAAWPHALCVTHRGDDHRDRCSDRDRARYDGKRPLQSPRSRPRLRWRARWSAQRENLEKA